MSMNTIIIRELYPDFVKRLKASTKDFVEHHFDSRSLSKIDDEQVDAHLLFIKRCYYDDVQELEEIIFFTSSPFYELKNAYRYIDSAYTYLKYSLDSSDNYWSNSFWQEYERMLSNGFLSIEFKDSKFYFKDVLVPTNPYNKNQINIVQFDLISQVHHFIKKHPDKTNNKLTIFSNLIKTDFVKNHDFAEYCGYDYKITK